MKNVEITYRYAARDTARARPADSAAALSRLDAGNQAFASLLEELGGASGTARRVVEVDSRDLGLDLDAQSAPDQRPFAVVIGCSDARVPIELIFSEGPNDLFVIRVAGNGLGTDVLGSLTYAVAHMKASLRLVVVLAHSECGAMTAAVDAFLDPTGYLALAASHALRTIVDRQLIVVQTCARKLIADQGADVMSRPGYRAALIETSIATNAALTAFTIQHELDRAAVQGLRAVYGVYLLQTRGIWTPPSAGSQAIRLAEPPPDLPSFIQFGSDLIYSDRIRALLQAD